VHDQTACREKKIESNAERSVTHEGEKKPSKFCPEEDEGERERKAWQNGRGENDMERISETKPRRRKAKEEK